MSKERLRRAVIAVSVGFGLGFVADQAADMSVSDHAVRQETPVAILPDKIVLIAPPKRPSK